MLRARLLRLTAPRVLLLFGACSLAAGLTSFVVHYSAQRPLVWSEGVVAGRDFLAFYAAGRLVLSGSGRELYAPSLQQATQAQILAPETLEGFLPFVNPASVAVLYGGIAALPYRMAFHLHTLAMLVAFALGMRLLLPRLSALGPNRWVLLLLGLSWLPMLANVMGGQNAALTFALLCGAYAATVARRPALAGLALGLLLFKPQYALPFAGLLLLRGQLASIGTFAAVALAHYGIGAAACGWSWPMRMFDTIAGPFALGERLANGSRAISMREALDYSLVLPFEGDGSIPWLAPVVSGVVIALSVGGAALLVRLWRHVTIDPPDFGLYWALVVPVTLLISPHTQFYEISLLLLPVFLTLNARIARGQAVGPGARLALIAGYFVFPAHGLAEGLGFQPLTLVPAVVGLWVLREIRSVRAAAIASPLAEGRDRRAPDRTPDSSAAASLGGSGHRRGSDAGSSGNSSPRSGV
jgi:hypothetical protein